MPSLSEALSTQLSASKYSAVPTKPPVISMLPLNSEPSNNLRCILPPFNSDPDTLRQFDNVSTGPKNRIWPSPQPLPASSTNTTTGTAASTNSSSSSSSSTVTLSPKTITFTTGALPAGAITQTNLQMAQSFQALSLSVNGPCEVRMYGTQTVQTFDSGRPTGNPVPPEISSNIIVCITFDTTPYDWSFQNIVGVNGANPQTSTIYVTVLNTNPLLSSPVTVSITYLPLES
jgi:hypothetical protein